MIGLTSTIDISPDHMGIVQEILRENLPSSVAVWVFGSRASWNTRDSSDLDLALEGDSALNHDTIINLEMAFEESELPYRVDVIDLRQVSSNFKRIVDAQKISLQNKKQIVKNNEWTTTTIEEFVPFSYGKSLPAHKRNTMGKIPVFGSNGIIGYHDFALTTGPTVIVGRKGTVGSVHYSDVPCWPIDTTFFFTNRDAELTQFRYYALSTLGLSNMNADSAVPGLNRSAAHARELRIPGEHEQRRIANILRMLDNKIELNHHMSQTLEAMARALFKSWFVDFEPVRAKMDGRWQRGESHPGLPAKYYDIFPDRLVDSELGEIPEGWQMECLEKFANLNPESWSQTNHPDSVEYADLANTKWGMIELTQHFSWESAPSRAKRVLRSGDTIIGTVRPGNGSYSFIGINDLTASTGFAVLRPIHTRFRELVYLSVTDRDNIERLAHRADGAAYPAVHSKVVGETKVAVPIINKKILCCFSNIVGPILDRIELAKKASRTLASQRVALLPKLMSGEFRMA